MLRPLGDKVIIRAEREIEKVTKSGIFLQETETLKRAIVVAIPTGFTDVKENDVILYDKNAGTEVQDGEDVFLAISSKSIWMVVEK